MNYIFHLLVIILIPVILILFFIISILIKIDSYGPIIHWSKRIGKEEKEFLMPKFRTMYNDTPQLASHLLEKKTNKITKIGSLLRKFSLDEVPQIYSILKGDMTLIGPRPALFNQYDLINLRRDKNINNHKPGLTGWAQVNGRDKLTIEEKVLLDAEYFDKKNLIFDLKIIFLTIQKVLGARDILH